MAPFHLPQDFPSEPPTRPRVPHPTPPRPFRVPAKLPEPEQLPAPPAPSVPDADTPLPSTPPARPTVPADPDGPTEPSPPPTLDEPTLKAAWESAKQLLSGRGVDVEQLTERAAESIEALIARSSLGTPGALAARTLAPSGSVETVLARVRELETRAPDFDDEPFDAAELDAVAQRLEQTGALDAFEHEALEAWNDDSIKLGPEDERHLDTARARVFAFAKDQALLDWLDEPVVELPYSRDELEAMGVVVDPAVVDDLFALIEANRRKRILGVALEKKMIGDVRSTGANQQRDGTTSPPSSGIVHDVSDVRVPDLSLAADSQGHGATAPFAVSPAGGGATGAVGAELIGVAKLHTAPPGEIGGDADVPGSGDDRSQSEQPLQAPAPLVRVTGGALDADDERPSREKVYEHFKARYSSRTKRAYESDLDEFAKWRGMSRDEAMMDFFSRSSPKAHSIVYEWLQAMTEEDFAPATQQRRLSALKAFTRFARSFGLVEWELDVDGPVAQGLRDTRGPAVEDVHKMFLMCGDGAKGQRNRVVVLFTAAGFRRKEIADLRLCDYNRRTKEIFVRGKGGERNPKKNRWVQLPDETIEELEAWLTIRGRGEPTDSILFGWKNKSKTKNLTPRGVHHIIRTLGKKAGIEVWPHAIRHSLGTTAVTEKFQLAQVQSAMRHDNPATTMIYVDNAEKLGLDVLRMMARAVKYGKEK